MAANTEPTTEGTVVGDEKTAMEAAIEAGPSRHGNRRNAPQRHPAGRQCPRELRRQAWRHAVGHRQSVFARSLVLAGDLAGQPASPESSLDLPGRHLAPGVYRWSAANPVAARRSTARVEPRVRSQPLDSAITTIPYATVAAFMSKPTVLDRDQIKAAPYVLATRDLHVIMSEGDTVYARGFTSPAELGTHYNVIRVGDPLRRSGRQPRTRL